MKNPIRYCVVLQLILTMTGCATQSSLDTVRNDVDMINTRLFSVEKDLGSTREEALKRLGSFEKGNEADVAAVRKLLADIQAKNYSTRTEMEAVNGKLDDLTLAVRKQTEEQRRYSDDADKRIIAMQDSIVKLQTANDELTKKVANLAQQQTVVTTPDSMYSKGMEAFKAGDMPGARNLFKKFIELSPHNELAGDVLYLIGESYYSEKNYDKAILTFQDVMKNYPHQEKVPAAMLKQSMAFKNVNGG
jgi:TolA-binding protein